MSAVSGVPELDRVFRELSKGMANRIARPGLLRAARVAAKKVKAVIPNRMKEARKAVKAKSVKTKFNAGFASAKVGFNVGEKKNSRKKLKPRTGKRKGVGLGARNAHWFAVGTDHRWTGTKRSGGHQKGRRNRRVFTGKTVRYTGRMGKQWEGVSSVVRRSKQEMFSIIKTSVEAGIDKEVTRQARRRL
jgi:hypothetical protein